MTKFWKPFFATSLLAFAISISVEFLDDYLKVGESAFNELFTSEFYSKKIFFSLIFALIWEFLVLPASKNKKADKQ